MFNRFLFILGDDWGYEINNVDNKELTAIEKTRFYMTSLGSEKSVANDVVLHYLENLFKDDNEDEEVDLKFVGELFDRGVDVNHIDETQQHAMFWVKKAVFIAHFV